MFVRINGNMTERVGNYAVWVVECMNSDGEWQLLTACYGPMSLSSAVLIARACENEKEKLPSPVDAQIYMNRE